MSGVHEVERTEERNRDFAAARAYDLPGRDVSRPFHRGSDADLLFAETKWPALARVLFITGSAIALWISIFLAIEAL